MIRFRQGKPNETFERVCDENNDKSSQSTMLVVLGSKKLFVNSLKKCVNDKFDSIITKQQKMLETKNAFP